MDIRVHPKKLKGVIQGVASKSYAHRALFIASLADGPSEITCREISSDIEATINVLRAIGSDIIVQNEKIIIQPKPPTKKCVHLDVRDSGSTFRFLLPRLGVEGVEAVIDGSGKISERPMESFYLVLEAHGQTIRRNRWPITVTGTLKPGHYQIPGNISSQYLSGALMSLHALAEKSVVEVSTPLESAPYVSMTLAVMRHFGASIEYTESKWIVGESGYRATNYEVEADWSNAAFWLATGVTVSGLQMDSLQGDRQIIDILSMFGGTVLMSNQGVVWENDQTIQAITMDATHCPDLIPIVCVLAAGAQGVSEIHNVSRLRHKESDRLDAMIEILEQVGAQTSLRGNTLRICGTDLERELLMDCRGDHRLAMACTILGSLSKKGVRLKGVECVNKSYPDFFHHYRQLGGAFDVI